MKRFYALVAVRAEANGFGIVLDDKALKTPRRTAFLMPTAALADAIADEWRAQGETILPAAMPLTRLANSAIDQVAPRQAEVAAEIARFAESDLICYRAEWPADLVARQSATWDPLVDWAGRRYDVALRIATGVIHQPQAPETLERLRGTVHALDPWRLTALHALVTIAGSLVIGLAVLEGALSAADGWTAGRLDDIYQSERWGDDPITKAAETARRYDFDAAARFLLLLTD